MTEAGTLGQKLTRLEGARAWLEVQKIENVR